MTTECVTHPFQQVAYRSLITLHNWYAQVHEKDDRRRTVLSKIKKQMTDRKQLNVPKKMSSLSCWFMFCIIFCLFYFHLDFFLRINESKVMLTYMNKFIFYFCMNFDSKNSLNYLIGQIFELFMNNSRTSILGISEQGIIC